MRTAARAATVIAALTAIPPTVSAAPPMAAEIQVDGDMRDWSEILTSPANVTHDGDGSTFGCAGSTDRDCPVAAGEHDLRRFAWTWDSGDLFFQIHRQAGGSADAAVMISLDRDSDGLMEASDVVVIVPLPGLSDSSAADVRNYVPAAPAGDPIASIDGFADGHALPGSLGPLVAGSTGAVAAAGPGARTWEGRVRWSRLGLPPGAPMLFHVSLGPSASLPGARDHAGASDGGPGSTAFRAVSIIPDRTASSAPGRTVQLPHWVENEGNVPTVFEVESRTGSGLDVSIWRDADLDAVPETWLAFDKGGDGRLDRPGDALAPGGDSDGNGVLDTGALRPGDGILFYFEIELPADSGGLTETLDVVASVSGAAAEQARVRDVIRVGELTIAADQRRTAAAGDAAWLPHVVQNNTFRQELVELSVMSSSGWSWDVLADPDRDGLPDDALPLTDEGPTGRPGVLLSPGQSIAVLARATVPPTALTGTQETAFVRAHLDGVIQSTVTDRVVVTLPLELGPNHLVEDGEARYGGAGERIYFAHHLANHRGAAETVDLAVSGDMGWPVTLLTDPDGDGRPYDSLPFAGTGIALSANGGVLPFLVAVDVPAGARLGEKTRVTVTARAAGGAAASVSDDAIAALIRLYDQPDRLVSVRRITDCGVAYARASGLTPATQHRFAWISPFGAVERVTPVITADDGTCEDEMTLGPQHAGEGWRAEIQRWDGFAWAALDQADMEIGDGWRMEELAPAPGRHHFADARVAASAVLRRDAWAQPSVVTLRWLVLSEERATVLVPDAGFVPYTGAEATARETLVLGTADEPASFAVASVTFPFTGRWLVEAWRDSACGVERLAAASAILVVDDADLDGLTREEELASGTDPDDADADDDGLPDGLDGASDSDGDGLIDARDCDSDDDGVLDGTEAGITVARPGTRPDSPCFAPDQFPGSTTDPDRADSDGGGIGDGEEDADRNGRVDPGERDPLNGADDFAGCSPDRPSAVRDLRVTRSGDAAVLAWTSPFDPCLTHVVLVSDGLPDWTILTEGLRVTTAQDAATQPSRLRAYSVRTDSALAGPGED